MPEAGVPDEAKGVASVADPHLFRHRKRNKMNLPHRSVEPARQPAELFLELPVITHELLNADHDTGTYKANNP